MFADPPSALLKLDAKQRLDLAFFAEPAATQAEPKTTTPLIPDGSLKVVHKKLNEIRKRRLTCHNKNNDLLSSSFPDTAFLSNAEGSILITASTRSPGEIKGRWKLYDT